MPTTAADVRTLVERLPAHDEVAVDHRERALAWLASTDDVFRREKPATPAPHLVGYFVVVDPASGDLLLADHRLSGLWLPTGGHVEPGEHPADTVRREVVEELGVPPVFAAPDPVLLTWTPTVGPDSHVDVSLWYVLSASPDTVLAWDAGEFRQVRWWSQDAVRAFPSGTAEPHLGRFLDAFDALDG